MPRLRVRYDDSLGDMLSAQLADAGEERVFADRDPTRRQPRKSGTALLERLESIGPRLTAHLNSASDV